MTKGQKAAETRRLNRERDERLAKLRAEARVLVATGKCPECGYGIRRNWSMTGWYQCDQYGAVGFRKHDDQPACNWQVFTD